MTRTVKRRLRLFVAVGLVVTAVDVAFLVGLARLGLHPAAADFVAVALASVTSWALHRAITFADDPHVRWLRRPWQFVVVAVVVGAIDVAVVALALRGEHQPGTGPLLAAKAAALLAAGVVRVVAYRGLLFTLVRREQASRARRHPPPGSLRLSVVIPAYGEEDRIAGTVERVRDALADVDGHGGLEVVVVDDGSGDGTAEAARAAGAVVVVHPENRGKGAAVRSGVVAARGRTIAFIDADLSYDPSQLHLLLAGVEDGWDVVVGSRQHPGSTEDTSSLLRRSSGRLFNVLTAAVLLGQYRDTQCGLKGFRSDVGKVLLARSRLDGFAFDVELFHLVERYRLSLTEVPVHLVTARGSTVRLGLDAARMIRDLVRVRRWAAQGEYELDDADRGVLARPSGR